ncbi:MAG: PKD domain-containing protein [Candidatus Gracilibacteria bacterium]|nr:PKD domain-containing protein [Candidatus Gracilibacteria bacterium]
MADNVFDPSKLNLDLDADKLEKEEIIPEVKAEEFSIPEKEEEISISEIIPQKEEKSDSLESFLSDLEEVSAKPEEILEEGKDVLSDISTIITDPSLQSEEQKAEIQAHKEEEILEIIPEKPTTIFDMNVNSIDDLIKVSLEKSYDFFIVEPKDDLVRVSFRKEGVEKEFKNIKFPVYSNLLIKAKTLAKANLEVSNIEQKGEADYAVLGKSLKLTIKIVPSNAGEKFFIKAILSENKAIKAGAKKQSNISIGQAATFLGAIFVIALILGSAFLTFVIMNAHTVDDVRFFRGLGISLGDINNFLQKLSTIVFSILLFIETIFLVIFIFKALITKKEFKKLKTKYTILAAFFLIISFSTASAWMLVDKKIKSLPNWQDEIYGDIQMMDNDKLLTGKFDRDATIIQDSSNLIGPVTIKYDLSRFGKKQMDAGFKITKFIWDFGNGDTSESLNSEFIKTFDKSGIYNVKLTAEGTDLNGEVKQVPVQNIPAVNITSTVNITENTMPNGGKTVVFDASSLKDLGELQWYTEDDLSKPIFTGPVFRPAKVFFDQALVGLYIKREGKTDTNLDKVFLVTGDNASGLQGQIKYEQSLDNDLKFNFSVTDPKSDFGNGFIKQFKWEIGADIITKDADLNDLSKSSEIQYTFKDYGDQDVKVSLIDSAGKIKQITQKITLAKKVKMRNKLVITNSDGDKVDYDYTDLNNEYTIKSLGTPTTLTLDASTVKTEQSIYILKDVNWDTNGDGKVDKTGKSIDFDINTPGVTNMSVEYTFFRINKKTDEMKVKEMINIESVEKDENLSLKVDQDSEYAPSKVSFDASASKVKGEDIVKFAYDYGDGTPVDIRDAINPGHIYTKDGDYTVKLTVTTATGKQYNIEKKVIIKPSQKTAKIDVSLKETTTFQTISFESKNSVGQVSTYSWDFGDGEISSDANPSHAYKKPGTYKVKLTLDFADNNEMTDETEITITN